MYGIHTSRNQPILLIHTSYVQKRIPVAPELPGNRYFLFFWLTNQLIDDRLILVCKSGFSHSLSVIALHNISLECYGGHAHLAAGFLKRNLPSLYLFPQNWDFFFGFSITLGLLGNIMLALLF